MHAYTCQQGNAKNPSRQASIAREPELPDVQAGFRKGRGTRDEIANIHWIIEKAREFQKSIYFCFIDYKKAFDYVDYNKLWKTLKEMGVSGHLTSLLRNLYMVNEQQLEPDTNSGLVQNWERLYIAALFT